MLSLMNVVVWVCAYGVVFVYVWKYTSKYVLRTGEQRRLNPCRSCNEGGEGWWDRQTVGSRRNTQTDGGDWYERNPQCR